jgi:hypothetical protein
MTATLQRMVRYPRTGEVHVPHEPLSIIRTVAMASLADFPPNGQGDARSTPSAASVAPPPCFLQETIFTDSGLRFRSYHDVVENRLAPPEPLRRAWSQSGPAGKLGVVERLSVAALI